MLSFIIIYILKVIILLIIVAFCISVIFSVTSFAPWLPSRSRDLPRIFKLAELKPGQTFYDLGCGDGKMVLYAAKNFEVKAIGIEILLPLYLICQFKKLFLRRRRVFFKFKNLFKEDLSSADVVYLFGIPYTLNKKISEKLKKELKTGAKIISYTFKLQDWRPKVVDKPSEKDLPIYLYEA